MTCECSEQPCVHRVLLEAETVLAPYIAERSLVRVTIAEILRGVPAMHNTHYPGDVEHCYTDALSHALNAHMDHETGWWRLLVQHPLNCGCDALTDELVLHG